MVEVIDDLMCLHLFIQHLHDNVERVSREVDDMIEPPRGGLLRYPASRRSGNIWIFSMRMRERWQAIWIKSVCG